MKEARVGRVLVAIDGSPAAQRALEQAADIAAAMALEIGVVSVAEERIGGAGEDARANHAAQLHAAIQWLEERGLHAVAHEPIGTAGPEIVRTAADFGYDTIVLGSRNLGAVKRALVGSVSEYVVTHASGTVIIAR